MSTARVYVPRLTRFVLRGMVPKLRQPKNEAKPDWRGLRPVDLLTRLLEEQQELLAALEVYHAAANDGMVRPGAARALREECADVANIAMMLWDVVGERQEALAAWKAKR